MPFPYYYPCYPAAAVRARKNCKEKHFHPTKQSVTTPLHCPLFHKTSNHAYSTKRHNRSLFILITRRLQRGRKTIPPAQPYLHHGR